MAVPGTQPDRECASRSALACGWEGVLKHGVALERRVQWPIDQSSAPQNPCR